MCMALGSWVTLTTAHNTVAATLAALERMTRAEWTLGGTYTELARHGWIPVHQLEQSCGRMSFEDRMGNLCSGFGCKCFMS